MGVICVAASRLVPRILYNGEGHMVWCCWMKVIIACRVWGYCLVYSHNDPNGRIQIWRQMAQSLPTIEWVLRVEFNMVDWDGDLIERHETSL
jgi:hypothetical protein